MLHIVHRNSSAQSSIRCSRSTVALGSHINNLNGHLCTSFTLTSPIVPVPLVLTLLHLTLTSTAGLQLATKLSIKHQIAKYLPDPRQSHGKAILYLVCYLKKTRNLGLKFKPNPAKRVECYCDTDFSGNWNKGFAPVPQYSQVTKWMDSLLRRHLLACPRVPQDDTCQAAPGQ